METGHPVDSVSPDQEWVALPDAARLLGVPTLVLRRWLAQGLMRTEWRNDNSGQRQVVDISTPLTPPTPDNPSDGSTPRMVGRQRELATLTAALESASAGRGAMVLVGGDAGIGKTTLVDEAVRTGAASGFQVITGYCFDVENAPAYGVWRDAFSGIFPTQAADGGPQQDGASSLFADIEEFTLQSARRAPLLIVLEDLHWADRASLDLLRSIARKIVPLPVAVIATYRDVDLAPHVPLYLVLPLLVREAPVVRMNLRPLSEEEVTGLLQLRYQLPESDAARLNSYIWGHAEGNPLFTEELALHLEQAGVLEIGSGDWQLGELPDFRVPPLIQQILAQRFDRVSETSLQLLKVASVIGIEVPLDLWQRTSGASQDELAACIDEALNSHLIVEDAPNASIRFRHALIRETLYDSLQIIRRREQHLHTALALAEAHNANASLVAHHFLLANDDRAVEWLIKAGRNAVRTFAFLSACEKFSTAMDMLERRPVEQSERAWLACELAAAYRYIDTEQALRWANRAVDEAAGLSDAALRVVVPWVRSHVRGFLGEDGLAELNEAVAALERLSREDYDRILQTSLAFVVSQGILIQRTAYYARYNEARRFAESFLSAAPTPSSTREHHDFGPAHIGLGLAYANLGSPDEARAAFATAREHLRLTSNHFLVGTAYSHEHRHVLEPYFPDLVEARRRVIDAADSQFRNSVVAVLSGNQTHKRIFGALILEGRWDEARAAAEGLVNSRYMHVECAEVLAELDWLQGHHERAWTWIDSAIPEGASVEPATTHYHEVLTLQRAAAELAMFQNELDLAMGWINALQRWLTWGDTVLGRYIPDMLLAQYYHRAGDLSLALEHARTAGRKAQEPRQPLGLMRAERLAGTLAGAAGKHDQAERHLGIALDLARAIQSPYDSALGEIAYAGHLIHKRERSDAVRLLSSARDTLEQLSAVPALALLEEVETRAAQVEADQTSRFNLSARELEVLRLVAQGLTDAEIGDQLFISRRTVSGHLQSIFNKCGVASRAAATAFAYEHNLITPNE